MSLEVLTGAGYNDGANNVQKQRTGSSTQDQNITNISITEVSGVTKNLSGTHTDQENGQNQHGTSEQQIRQVLSQANNKMKANGTTRCEFSYHEETRRVSIKVYDNQTEQIIREIPPEETLDMLEKMWELAGLLVDERR